MSYVQQHSIFNTLTISLILQWSTDMFSSVYTAIHCYRDLLYILQCATIFIIDVCIHTLCDKVLCMRNAWYVCDMCMHLCERNVTENGRSNNMHFEGRGLFNENWMHNQMKEKATFNLLNRNRNFWNTVSIVIHLLANSH